MKNPLICVEDVNPPKPFFKGKQSITNTKSIIETAAVIGAILGRYPEAFVVPPGHNGQGYLPAYPPMLVGERETSGKGVLRHTRSAYDVCQVVLNDLKASA